MHISNTSPIYLQYISNFSPILIIGDVLEENWRKTGGSLVQLPREYLAVTSQLPRGYLAVTVRLPRGYPALAPFRLPQGVPWLPPMLLLNYP